MASHVTDFVWIPDSEDVWLQGEVVAATEDKSTLICKTAKGEKRVATALVKLKNSPAEDEWSDLAVLTHLDEPNVLQSLHVRFHKNQIYTWTGPILLAVNPWKTLPGMYDIHRRAAIEADEEPPHVFSVAHKAYTNLLRTGHSQSVLVSGESGSGKTESTKYVIQYLATVGHEQTESTKVSFSQTEQQVLQTNPILEAFGNASTLRNDNSSRFGKFVILQFEKVADVVRPKILGATIQTYLLEKTRVAQVTEMERNYHVFHQLSETVLSRQQKEDASTHEPTLPPDLGLGEGRSFDLLGNSNRIPVVQRDDISKFAILHDALKSIGVKEDDWYGIVRSLAGLMHLGNVRFLSDTTDSGSSDVDTAVLQNFDSVQRAAELLQCEAKALSESLLERHVKAGEESVVVIQSRLQASLSRDALLKAVYSRLFLWLMKRINSSLSFQSLSASQNDSMMQGCDQIGILDIFGFEFYQINSFEQLTINFANESLQMQFNRFVFQNEQEEYEREKIPWSHIDFIDNQPCVELIAGHPNGILSCLDEECRVPGGSDSRLAHKVRTMKHTYLEAPKLEKDLFKIKHYAGQVSYSCAGFLEKNRDSIHPHLVELMQASNSDFVRALFAADAGSSQQEARPGSKGSVSLESVGGAFKRQLAALTQAIERTQVHYIRCINSNHRKAPGELDRASASHQLRCGGVIEAVRVTRAGFPARIALRDFCLQFRALAPAPCHAPQSAPEDEEGERARIVATLNGAGMAAGADYEVGQTKVFLRDGRVQQLQVLLAEKASSSATRIQAAARGRSGRERARQRRRALGALQAATKRALAVRRMAAWRGAGRLQGAVRGVRARQEFVAVVGAVLALQRWQRPQQAAGRSAAEDGKRAGQADSDGEGASLQGESMAAENGEVLAETLGGEEAREEAAVGAAAGCSQCQDWGEKVGAIEEELERLQGVVQGAWAEQAELACRLEQREAALHLESDRAARAEEAEREAEQSMLRAQRDKDAALQKNQELAGLVATLQKAKADLESQVEEMARRAQEQRAREDKHKVQIAELTRQRARLTRLCTSTGPSKRSPPPGKSAQPPQGGRGSGKRGDAQETADGHQDRRGGEAEAAKGPTQTHGCSITSKAVVSPTPRSSPAICRLGQGTTESPRGLSTPEARREQGDGKRERGQGGPHEGTPLKAPGFMLQACSRLRASMSPSSAPPVRREGQDAAPGDMAGTTRRGSGGPQTDGPSADPEVGGGKETDEIAQGTRSAHSQPDVRSSGVQAALQAEAAAPSSKDAAVLAIKQRHPAPKTEGAAASRSPRTSGKIRGPGSIAVMTDYDCTSLSSPRSNQLHPAVLAPSPCSAANLGSPRVSLTPMAAKAAASSTRASPRPRTSGAGASGSSPSSIARSPRAPASDKAVAAAAVVMRSRRSLPR